MKKFVFTTSLMLLCVIGFSQTPEDLKAWEEYMTPTESHKWLATLNGEWDASIKMWMDPLQPPLESKGTMVNKMIMDGRYQVSDHTGSFNNMPFNGQSLTAFDNAKKEFQMTWIDNMGTGIMIMKGVFDNQTKTLTMYGNILDPLTAKDLGVKEVITYMTEDSHKFEMFIVDGKSEMKSMEIIYNRKRDE